MQDVFLAVLPRLETVSGGVQGLRTFIFSVAHARRVDDHRRQSRAPAKLPFDAELDLREESSAEAEALERKSWASCRACSMSRKRCLRCASLAA